MHLYFFSYPDRPGLRNPEIVGQMQSKLKMEGTNWREMARYLKMTCSPGEVARYKIKKFLPTRSKTGGSEPGITGAEAQSGSCETQQWIFPRVEPSNYETKLLVAACIAVGVRHVFSSHVYSFTGKLFQQISGGAIGLRLTSVVTRIQMARWIRVVIYKLKIAGLTI